MSSNLSKSEEAEEYRAASHDWQKRWKATDDELQKLKNAIKKHRDQKSDDRCWLDDLELYSAAGLDFADNSIGDKFQMLKNCARFIETRCANGKWRTYAELEELINKYEKFIESQGINLANL